ncbi:hypothetical protein RPALISO_196 [Ruegeria phage RpAliso]|nr:hypothetical protein RPALISO_196 [Ruegeria phage RpAliso]
MRRETPETLVPADEVIRVHGTANFGSMTPREVIDEGVMKYAFGQHTGHTMKMILTDHGLIRHARPYQRGHLTPKGKRYLRALAFDKFDKIMDVIKERTKE